MKPKAETTAAPLAVIGVDIGKDVFHLIGLGADGKVALRRRIRRLGLRDVFEKLPGYIDRHWPPAFADSGAWPLGSLRQSFLNGTLTRLLDPERVLRTRIIGIRRCRRIRPSAPVPTLPLVFVRSGSVKRSTRPRSHSRSTCTS